MASGTGWLKPMRFRHSLRVRIIIAFGLFGILLSTLYAVGIYVSLDMVDDYLINNRLKEELEHFKFHIEHQAYLPRPTSRLITAYIGTDSMPPWVQQMIGGITKGLHEVYRGKDEFHLAVFKLPNYDQPLYLLFDVNGLEFISQRRFRIFLVLAAEVILFTVLGVWIGWLTWRKVMAPVSLLAELVGRTGPDNLPADLSKNFVDDEVGVLAKALAKAMQRAEAFVEREQQFTRDASHELRTPVAVIKGAVEVMQAQLNEETYPLSQPLNRIKRAGNQMEDIIEALLWLAHENHALDLERTFAVPPVVHEAIENNRHLVAKKPVAVRLVSEGNPRLLAPPNLFRIAVSNLLRNAFHYTETGKISIEVHSDRVVISDTGSGIAKSNLATVIQPFVRAGGSGGIGLGLSITKRLCDRFGWRLEIDSEVGQGTIVQLIFRPSEPEN